MVVLSHDAYPQHRWCRRRSTDMFYSAHFQAPIGETASSIWITDHRTTCIHHLVPCAGAHLSRKLHCGYAGQPGLTWGPEGSSTISETHETPQGSGRITNLQNDDNCQSLPRALILYIVQCAFLGYFFMISKKTKV